MSAPEEAHLREGVARILGSSSTAGQTETFLTYLDLLQAWNRVYRMVGSSDRAWLVDNVILDSLLFLRVLPPLFGSLLDIGSGAGIPGIPIKIARPEVSLTMVESRGKRASFLSSAVRTIRLTGASVVRARAEDLVEDGARFDAVVARCAGAAASVLDLAERLVSRPGIVVVSGGPDNAGVPRARRVRLVNPASGRPRTFLVRDVEG